MDFEDTLQGLAGRVICWDLDRTLGVFRPLGRDRPGPRPPGPEVGLRPHVRETIEALDRAGAIHVLTTASTPEHAERALQRAGVRHRFRRIYTGTDLIPTYGVPTKDYALVARDFGLFGREGSARMIVIGDTLTIDLPANGPVFVWERGGANVSARLTLWILATLTAAGGGDFLAGYRALNRPGGPPTAFLGGELEAPTHTFILKLWEQSGVPVISLHSKHDPLPLEPLPDDHLAEREDDVEA